jgi:predicted PurR-regulated permease PerM
MTTDEPPLRHPSAPREGNPTRALRAADLWALAGATLLLALAWRLASVLLLAFAGTLLALVLRRLTEPLHRRLKLSPRGALALVVVGLLALVVGGLWLAGSGIAEQVEALRVTLPRAVEALRRWLEGTALGRSLLEFWDQAEVAPDDWSGLAGWATGTLNATVSGIGGLVLLLVLGIYLAADPETYRRGVLRLLPPPQRPRLEALFDDAGHDLSRWLLGQAVSMSAVALLTLAGLLAIGQPLAVTLAVLAGLLDFVPYIGPIVAGVLIVAVALTESETQALLALVVVVAVQQAEAFVVQPLAQRWAVRLPPVLGLLSVLVFGVLFGLAGVLLATPLMVLTLRVVDHLVVHGGAQGRTQ